jgi:hypothetical protein
MPCPQAVDVLANGLPQMAEKEGGVQHGVLCSLMVLGSFDWQQALLPTITGVTYVAQMIIYISNIVCKHIACQRQSIVYEDNYLFRSEDAP